MKKPLVRVHLGRDGKTLEREFPARVPLAGEAFLHDAKNWVVKVVLHTEPNNPFVAEIYCLEIGVSDLHRECGWV